MKTKEFFLDQDEYDGVQVTDFTRNPTVGNYIDNLTRKEILIFRLHVEERLDEVEIAERLGYSDDNEVLEKIEQIFFKLRPIVALVSGLDPEQFDSDEVSSLERGHIVSAFEEEMNRRENQIESELQSLRKRK